MPTPPTLDEIRSQFPALDAGTVYLDNAGGSQLPRCVIAQAARCLRETYAQLGGDYAPSLAASQNLRRAHEVAKVFVHASPREFAPAEETSGSVIIGHSSTALCHLLASCYASAADRARQAAAGSGASRPVRDEVIVATAGHEANIGPWLRLAERGWKVTLWPTEIDDEGLWRPRVGTLERLISARTRVVAFPQVSNILGQVWDVAEVCEVVRRHGARSVVDGVAFAPHAAPDVRAYRCDWYVYSSYKVMGPHAGVLYGSHEALAELDGPNHEFIPRHDVPRVYEVGGVAHEACAMILGLWEYACYIARRDPSQAIEREVFERAFAYLGRLEHDLTRRLLDGLSTVPRVRLVGSPVADARRVSTVSFTAAGATSASVARSANLRGIGIRFGSFYSRRLAIELGIDPDDGVVRISPLHYTSPGEVDLALDHVQRVLSAAPVSPGAATSVTTPR
ncbi:MAG: aminotransferase class V-fold PLP-dependent enzyme [Planctomycetota bacterium]|nr:aminotransferase class V-fold PLP-dependent enzyme [Planctomycetota bacterium]